MSYIGDLSTYINSTAGVAGTANASNSSGSTSDIYGLDMNDFLQLMVAELTNQSIDSTADTSEMINQMVQMQMVQALVNMTDASIMSYAASLVGKEVTIGVYDSEGNLQEIVGTVTATGSYGDDQVVFVDGNMHYLSEIMAVGKLDGAVLSPDGSAEDTGAVDGTDGTSGSAGMVDPDEVTGDGETAEADLYSWLNMTTTEIDEAASQLTEDEINALLAAITGANADTDWSELTDEQSESLDHLIYVLTGEYPAG